MKATLNLWHQAMITLMDTVVMKELGHTALKIEMVDIKERVARFVGQIQAARLTPQELRTIKDKANRPFEFEASNWNDSQHAVATLTWPTMHSYFDSIELKITVRQYMTCTPDKLDGAPTTEQMAKLRKMFIDGDVKLSHCKLGEDALPRCADPSCADTPISEHYEGYCYFCYTKRQHDLAEEQRANAEAQDS